MDYKTGYQLFGQKGLDRELSVKINLLKLLQQRQLRSSICILEKVLFVLAQMLIW